MHIKSKDRINIGIIGCGCVAGYGHLPAITGANDFNCVAYADIDRSRAESFATRFGRGDVYTDYRRVLEREDIDAVGVLTLPSSHGKITIDALSAGKHVFVEKPIAAKFKEGEAMCAAARRYKRKLFVGFLLRYTGAYQTMVKMAQDGAIGRPMMFRMQCFEHYAQTQISSWERAKGVIMASSPAFDCGSHYVDIMRWSCGGEAILVRGMGARINPDLPKGYFDYESYQIEFSEGSRGIYEAGWGYSFPAILRREIIGPKGRLEVSYGVGEESKESGIKTIIWNLKNNAKIVCRSESKGFAAEWKQFAEMIRKNMDPWPGLSNAMASLSIVEAGHQSALTGKMICLQNHKG